MEEDQEQRPDSLLPYDEWTEDALRQVMIRALQFAAVNGLPGEHHFYLTFRTDHPGTVVPPRLRAQYPQEMTIVLQHQFWGLSVDTEAGMVTVGLSFGGVPATLAIPVGAITAFADPHVRYGVRFHIQSTEESSRDAQNTDEAPAPKLASEPEAPAEEAKSETPQIVSLDAFRRRTAPRDSNT